MTVPQLLVGPLPLATVKPARVRFGNDANQELPRYTGESYTYLTSLLLTAHTDEPQKVWPIFLLMDLTKSQEVRSRLKAKNLNPVRVYRELQASLNKTYELMNRGLGNARIMTRKELEYISQSFRELAEAKGVKPITPGFLWEATLGLPATQKILDVFLEPDTRNALQSESSAPGFENGAGI